MGELAVDGSRAPRRLGLQERALVVGFALLLWLTRFSPPEAPATPDLDPSWAQALGFALVHHLQFGVDVVFTYGPLGWFAHSAWQPELDGWKLWFFEVAFRLCLAGFFAHALLRLCGPLERLFFALLLLVPDPGIEAFYFAAVLCLAAWILERRERAPLSTLPVWLLLAIIACIKFTYLVLAVFAALCIVVPLFAGGARRKALVHAGLALGMLVLVWSACGQAPWNLPVYVWRSWELSQGYAQAMGHASEPFDLWLTLGSLSLGLSSVVLAARAKRERWQRGLLFAGGAFLAFKAGFVIGGTTLITTYGFAFVTPYLFALRSDAPDTGAWRRRAATLARALAVVLAFWGYQRCQDASENGTTKPFAAWNERLAFSLDRLTRWSITLAEHASLRLHLAEEFALPRMKERIGRESVDAMPTELGVVFLNDFAWRPRPVIQSYAAYTPALIELNARHFRSERAPRFVILRYGSIDNRLPGADDAGALEALLEGYRIVLVEKSYLLLERAWSTPPREPPRHTVFEGTVAFGERLELPKVERGAAILRVDVPLTLRGRAYEFLLRTPELRVRVETDDGFLGRFRAVPGQLAHGVLVDPWPGWPEALETLLVGTERHRMSSVRFACDPDDAALFGRELRVRIDQIDDFVLPAPDPVLARRLRFPVFDRPPDAVEGALPMSRGTVGATVVYVVHAPSELRFDLGEGRWRVRARFGLLPGAWEEGATDGAAFLFGFKSADASGTLWRQLVDPLGREPDRQVQEIEKEFDLPPQASFTMRTNPGPRGDGTRDWCYWTDVRIERVPPP